ncbi:low temperature requirement protein A [Novosphingobium sp. Gsoil 351]|uniref:low temperature requirement protein A n=1 Tax=Novosphingobium sp. Gsoil 351 TaxID=2675225 RepID=UPI0012B4AAB7|nr:low temperature requirement protein A [Novosphingobium sp. Gsoil 351]QGN56217.1 low temperature requirement protein A [Novosphingobium sp. Gsoil 351]
MAEAPSGIGAALAGAREQSRRSLLRNHGGGHASVSNLELFFDLVFVFAITQLSHFLLQHLDWLGAAQTIILFFAVWWAWMYTTWATNWIDPDRPANRFLIGAVMLASLVMACALPGAFGAYAWQFVSAYLTVQIGRTAYTSYALGEWKRGSGFNMLRASLWFGVSAIPWIGGLLTDQSLLRMAWWTAALAIEYAGPLALFWFPWLGRSRPQDWEISGSHMAERCGLFIIVALGEGLIITGATYAGAEPMRGIDAAFVNAFLGSFAMWWIYFDIGARRGAWHIEHHEVPGLIARQAFTYWHLPIVAGIVLLAVVDELTLAHPFDPVHPDFVALVAGGMALFVGGNMAFKRISSGSPWYPLSHGIGLGLTLAIAVWGLATSPPRLALAAASTIALATIALWEWGSFHGGWIERMEARGWWLGRVLRRRMDRGRARREAKAAAKA